LLGAAVIYKIRHLHFSGTHVHSYQTKTFSPVHIKFQAMVAVMYIAAVIKKTVLKDLVASTMNPTAVTPMIPDKEPNVLHSPNILPSNRVTGNIVTD
jgi:hypothetical protein